MLDEIRRHPSTLLHEEPFFLYRRHATRPLLVVVARAQTGWAASLVVILWWHLQLLRRLRNLPGGGRYRYDCRRRCPLATNARRQTRLCARTSGRRQDRRDGRRRHQRCAGACRCRCLAGAGRRRRIGAAGCGFRDLRNTLQRIPQITNALARRSRRIVGQNLGWAIGYNLLALPLTATGHVTPWIDAVGMALSSLLVTLNALRLTRMPADTAAYTAHA